jgi:pyridoxine 5-phosphate synthase
MIRLSVVNLDRAALLRDQRNVGYPRLAEAAAEPRAAAGVGLAVPAGHDLNLDDLNRFLRAVPGCAEVSVGHAPVADALRRGWREAVAGYRHAIVGAAASPGEA